jgi:anti-sigma regulatory factor (Ser/Thr protein kinase)
MTSDLEREPAPSERVVRAWRRLEESVDGWVCATARAADALSMRAEFRTYLAACAERIVDLDAVETLYAELVANCVRHAPGPVRIEWSWRDLALTVVDAVDRLRHWPFSADDLHAERTHRCYAIVRALSDRVHVARDPAGGTRVRVALPLR